MLPQVLSTFNVTILRTQLVTRLHTVLHSLAHGYGKAILTTNASRHGNRLTFTLFSMRQRYVLRGILVPLRRFLHFQITRSGVRRVLVGTNLVLRFQRMRKIKRTTRVRGGIYLQQSTRFRSGKRRNRTRNTLNSTVFYGGVTSTFFILYYEGRNNVSSMVYALLRELRCFTFLYGNLPNKGTLNGTSKITTTNLTMTTRRCVIQNVRG